ncbi:MAG: FAD/NAD(P)-binding protein [Candidatus Sericytochromatia bacterium]|nr:FAD/NAD(P)-binding protein [Candidatus Sericytochromatia bacterium]
MLDWLIVGGGIHGTHLALVLTRDAGVPRHRVRVLDPHLVPLEAWTRRALNVGMTHLRSPAPYHLDTDPMALTYFVREAGSLTEAPFLEPYKRPSLELFSAHCGRVIDRHGLLGLRLRGEALALRAHEGHVEVDTREGTLQARRVVLAMGGCERPAWPAWASALRAAGAPVAHVFEPGFSRAALPAWEQAVVVGGGISAHQLALALGARQPGQVLLATRHAPRVHLLDSDPGWSTPRLLGPFRQLRDPAERRAAIREARRPGSVPTEVHAAARAAIAAGSLAVTTSAISAAVWLGGRINLAFADGSHVATDRVVLATGFSSERPGGLLVDEAVARHALPLAPCGYPLVDAALRWHPRLHVMGPLAELEVGPIARNIIGAQHAAARIATAAA